MPLMEISVASIPAFANLSRWNNVRPGMSVGVESNVRLYDIDKKGDRRKAEEIVHSMVDSAIEMEGTCTGGSLSFPRAELNDRTWSWDGKETFPCSRIGNRDC